MIVTKLSLSEYYELIVNNASNRGFHWVFMFIGREAEAERIYADLEEKWASLNDLTFDRIAFVFSAKTQTKNNSFYHTPKEESYVGKMCPFAKMLGQDYFKDNEGDFELYYEDFNKYDWKELHTQSISEFTRKHDIAQADLPGLFIYSILTKTACFVKLQKQDDIYSLIERFVEKTQQIDEILDEDISKLENSKVKKVVDLEDKLRKYADEQDEDLKNNILGYLSGELEYKRIKYSVASSKIRNDLKLYGQWKRQLKLEEEVFEEERKLYCENKEEYLNTLGRMQELLSEFDTNQNSEGDGEHNMQMQETFYPEEVDVGIITALEEEYTAVIKILGENKILYDNGRNKGNWFGVGVIPSADGGSHHVAVMLSGENNNLSAIACTEMLNFFHNMKTVVMCGIAAGIPDQKNPKEGVHLGDVVVATSVIQADYGKATEKGFILKAIPTKCSPGVIKAVNRLSVDEMIGNDVLNRTLIEYATDKFKRPDDDTDPIVRKVNNQKVKVIKGTIASSNLVVKYSELRDYLQSEYNAKAIEMEGSGIADAATDNDANFIIVRGICDYADEKKDDTWHKYASMSAATYTTLLISKLPL